MTKRTFRAAAFGLLLAAQIPAGAATLPETYSFTASSVMSGPSTLTVNRNGSKELVDMDASSSGLHIRVLYDFQAHRIYTVDIETKTCTTQEYASPYAPVQWDPIGGAETMTRDAGSLKPVGQEAVNGIPAKLVESPFPDGKGKYRLWLDEKYGFPVKQTFVTGTQPERVLFEMRKISYAPSAASLFAVPANCTPASKRNRRPPLRPTASPRRCSRVSVVQA
jgi:outer membrane lipoprotein-sorting protein